MRRVFAPKSYGQFILVLAGGMVHYGSGVARNNMTMGATLCRWAKDFRADQRGQDLVEYALMAALVVVAVVSGLAPWVAPTISQIFSKVGCVLNGS
jgi:Flp pilus assembly pilin Flp